LPVSSKEETNKDQSAHSDTIESIVNTVIENNPEAEYNPEEENNPDPENNPEAENNPEPENNPEAEYNPEAENNPEPENNPEAENTEILIKSEGNKRKNSTLYPRNLRPTSKKSKYL